ncbi:hypothetical protein HDU98_010990 [Podochytrium sp. JEL0797]|nr:hypothetical protein HDU98_010990 [Podochytrium sp. JEL0797]
MNTTTLNSTAPANAPSMFPPGYVPNFALLAAWDSSTAAYIFMGLAILFTVCTLRNLIFFAKTKHTKAVYFYLLMWCFARVAAFALRGYALTGENGDDYGHYEAAQIILSIGFMPLAEVLTFNIAEASTLIYELSHRTYLRLRILIMVLFVVFGTSVTAYVIDFTINRPFGSNAKNFHGDLILRELGFNGLFLITLYTLFASIRNSLAVTTKHHIPTRYAGKMRTMMRIVAFQSFLMIIKLSYITYRNWNPENLRDEKYWYTLSISPEMIYMSFFVSHTFLDVYDSVEAVVGEDGVRMQGGVSIGNPFEPYTIAGTVVPRYKVRICLSGIESWLTKPKQVATAVFATFFGLFLVNKTYSSFQPRAPILFASKEEEDYVKRYIKHNTAESHKPAYLREAYQGASGEL